MRIQVAVINASTKIDDDAVEEIVAALQKQVDNEFRETWGMAARLKFVGKKATPPPGSWWLAMLDNSDQAGALGYHDLTPDLHPISKVFVAEDLKYHALPSVTASHELLEMLGDPYINETVLDPHTGRLYAMENADAVEADELGYEIDGVRVSDFVLPQYFDPQHRGKGQPLSFKGNVTEPFSLAPGGYLSYLDLNHLNRGWQQVKAQGAPEEGRAEGQRHVGFPPGSRRERRIRAGENELKVSRIHA
jgi:hypothetical protein